jgi:hypothetical protein
MPRRPRDFKRTDDDPIQPGEAMVENCHSVMLDLDLRCECGKHHSVRTGMAEHVSLPCRCCYFIPGYLGAPVLIRRLTVIEGGNA